MKAFKLIKKLLPYFLVLILVSYAVYSVHEGFSNPTYDCPSGYTKANDNMCYKCPSTYMLDVNNTSTNRCKKTSATNVAYTDRKYQVATCPSGKHIACANGTLGNDYKCYVCNPSYPTYSHLTYMSNSTYKCTTNSSPTATSSKTPLTSTLFCSSY